MTFFSLVVDGDGTFPFNGQVSSFDFNVIRVLSQGHSHAFHSIRIIVSARPFWGRRQDDSTPRPWFKERILLRGIFSLFSARLNLQWIRWDLVSY